MESLSTKEIPCKGLDERHLTDRGSARVAKNLRAANVGWKNDRGWEPFRVAIAADQQFHKNKLTPVDNLHIWTRHNGSEVYYLQQQDGKLFYELGNNNGTLDADRVELVRTAQLLAEGQRREARKTTEFFTEEAKLQGLQPERIIINNNKGRTVIVEIPDETEIGEGGFTGAKADRLAELRRKGAR